MNLVHVAKHVSLSAVFSLGLITSAFSAPVVTILNQSTQGAGNQAAVFGADYDGTTPAGATWTPSSPKVTPPPGNINSVFQSPFNNTGDLLTTSYFSVFSAAANGGTTSPATLTLGTPLSAITILWGSIDSYNTIEFFDGATSLLSLTGQQLLGKPNTGSYEEVALVNFDFAGDLDTFTSIKFSSGKAAFEFALQRDVPEPGSLALLGLGLAGLAAASRRKQKQA